VLLLWYGYGGEDHATYLGLGLGLVMMMVGGGGGGGTGRREVMRYKGRRW